MKASTSKGRPASTPSPSSPHTPQQPQQLQPQPLLPHPPQVLQPSTRHQVLQPKQFPSQQSSTQPQIPQYVSSRQYGQQPIHHHHQQQQDHHLLQQQIHPSKSGANNPHSHRSSSQQHMKEIGEKTYEFLQHVGSGAYGQVFKARDPTRDNSFVAIKQIRIRRQSRHYETGMPMAAVREIALLKQLEKMEHPNIVRLLDVHHQIIGEGDICLSLVFEFIDQDLNMYLERCPSPGLGPDRIRDLMLQMVNGIDFLHSNRIVHRDLKPQNILVTRNGNLKLADFGLARIYASDMVLTTVVVTLYYRAPEVLLTGHYATPVDMWSCGCIFAEMFIRRPLFKGTSEGDQLKKIFDVIGLPDLSQWPESAALLWASFRQSLPPPIDHFVSGLDRQAKDLLERFLLFQPEKRITAKDALHHVYFRDDLDSIRTSSSLSTSENDSLSDSRSDTPVSK